MQVNVARPCEGIKRLDGRFELHAIVSRIGLAPVHRLAMLAANQQGAPAAGTGISSAGPIGIYLNDFGQNGCGKPG